MTRGWMGGDIGGGADVDDSAHGEETGTPAPEVMRFKLCGFCGASDARLFGSTFGVDVRCGTCGARGPYGDTPEDATRRWNTRSVTVAEETIRDSDGEGAA